MAVHPDDELFATAGYDKNISLWKRHALLWNTQVRSILPKKKETDYLIV